MVLKITSLQSIENQHKKIQSPANPPKSGYRMMKSALLFSCCILFSGILIAQKGPLSADHILEKGIVCGSNGKDAEIRLRISGGNPPYNIRWTGGLSGENPKQVGPGNYAVTIIDAKGQSRILSIPVPDARLQVKIRPKSGITAVGKSDGSAEVDINGNAAGIQIRWDNGETTPIARALSAGPHSVTVSNAQSCTATATTVVEGKNLPPKVTLSEVSAIRCFGDKNAVVRAEVSGGKAPFVYTWDDPALRGEQAENVGPGIHRVLVRDADGKEATANIRVDAPPQLTLRAELKQAATEGLSNGSAQAIATGGTGAYKFQWESGESGESAVRLRAGTQGVTITDAKGCMATAVVQVNALKVPLSLKLQEKTANKCAGVRSVGLEAEVSGGKAPYQYLWSSAVLSGSSAVVFEPGLYSLTVIDADSTVLRAEKQVLMPKPLQISLSSNVGASQEGAPDGKAEVAFSEGTAPYRISWSNRQSGKTADKLTPGPHSVTVTDANGCAQSLDFTTEIRVFTELTGKVEKGQTIRMRRLNFKVNSDSLEAEARPMLDEVYDFLQSNPQISIEVAGHTNNQPDDAYADKLSTARAKAVADYLTGKGIAAERVTYKGYGKRQPIAPNTTAEGRKTNQRVEIRIR